MIHFLKFSFHSEPYHDIRYNLMAVVADGMTICEEKLKRLSAERYVPDCNLFHL